jgi:hypothetical protein
MTSGSYVWFEPVLAARRRCAAVVGLVGNLIHPVTPADSEDQLPPHSVSTW